MSRAPASILGRGRLLAQAGGAAGGARRPQLVVLVHDALPDRVRMDQLTIAWPSPPTRWGYFAPFPSPPLKGNIRTDRCCPPPSNSAVRSVVARRTAALSKHSTRSPSFPPHPRGEVQRVISEGSTRPLAWFYGHSMRLYRSRRRSISSRSRSAYCFTPSPTSRYRPPARESSSTCRRTFS
jgi:hypothetical protein